MHHLRGPYRHVVGRSSYNPAGRAPPRFRSPSNTLSTPTSSTIRRPLPPPPRNKDSSSGVSGTTEMAEIDTVTTARLRSFKHHIPLKHDVKYTYAEISSSPNVVYFFEYRGYGFPSSTLGALGDIYIDVTEDSYALYAKGVSDWTRWTVAGWLEHPFLTDTVLGFLLDSVVWIHPMKVDRPSQAAELHYAIRDMLIHEAEVLCSNQASRKQPETDNGDDADAMAAGNGSRKRPRVDDEPSSIAHNSEPPSSPLSEVQVDEDFRPVDIAPTKITSSVSQAAHSASHQPRKKSMDTRISVLQQEMPKLQEDLRELQVENARVRITNEKLLDEAKTLRDENAQVTITNEKLLDEVTTLRDENHRLKARMGDALADAEPSGKSTLGRIAQSMNSISDTASNRLPADFQNRLQGFTDYAKSFVDEWADERLNMQRAVADLKRRNNTLSDEVQTHRDTCARIEAERKELGERFRSLNTWVMHLTKFDGDGGG